MAHEPVERKLTAILFADVKDYSRLMGEDEAATLSNLKLFRGLITTHISRHHGRVVGAPGDALLAEFGSVVDAVEGAIEIQREMRVRNSVTEPKRRMEFRIGINLGDVIVSEDSLYGDGVNIAARMESLASPGGICITGTVYEHIKNKLPAPLESIGQRTVKNISDPISVYRVLIDEPENQNLAIDTGPRYIHGPRETHPSRRTRTMAVVVSFMSIALVAFALLLGTDYTPLEWIGKNRSKSAPKALTNEIDEFVEATSNVQKQDATTAFIEQRPSAVAVMNFRPLSTGQQQAWMGEAIRDNFNSQFRRLSGLEVYSKEYIDFLMQEGDVTEMQIAKELGIAKMISGSFVSASDTLRIETHVVDVKTGLLEVSDYVEGDLSQFFRLQQELAVKVIRTFHPSTQSEDVPRIASAPAAPSLDTYKLLMEAENESEDLASALEEGKSSLLRPDPIGYGSILRWLGTKTGPSFARADENGSVDDGPLPQKQIKELLEIYRLAYEQKSLDLLTGVYEVMSDKQRAARVRYFENTTDLQVAIQDVRIAVRGNNAIVSYTREDQFTDKRTGKGVKVDVRLTKSLARIEGQWKIIRKKK